MKKFIKYLKSLPAKAASFYRKAKAFVTKLIPQDMKDELTLKGGVKVFAECITFISLLTLVFLLMCMLSVMI